jgi:hypothetical protein
VSRSRHETRVGRSPRSSPRTRLSPPRLICCLT